MKKIITFRYVLKRKSKLCPTTISYDPAKPFQKSSPLPLPFYNYLPFYPKPIKLSFHLAFNFTTHHYEMAEVESKKIECESPVEAPKDVAEEKSVIPVSPCEEKPDDSKALVIVESKRSFSH